MAIVTEQTYTGLTSSADMTAPSVAGLSSLIKGKPGNIPQTSPYHDTVVYEDGIYKVNGVDATYGIGGILASSGLKLKLTDNAYKEFISAETKIPKTTDLLNFNQWIREQYQISTGNYDSMGKRYDVSVGALSAVKPDTRQIGQVIINSNYELEFAGPLDARLVTPSEATLTNPVWWLTAHSRPVYFYTGMPVTVESTGQLFIYMGYNTRIQKNDLTSRYALSKKFWKRASFEIDDIKNSGVVIPAVSVKGLVNVQTHSRSSWTDTGGMLMSPSLDPYGTCIMMSDHMISLGVQFTADYPHYKRKLQGPVRGGDAFAGLTIIPDTPKINWDNNAFHQNAKRVELSNANGPTIIRNADYKDPSCTQMIVDQSSILSMYHGNVTLAAHHISLTAKYMDFGDMTNIELGANTKIEAYENLSISADQVCDVSAANLKFTTHNGTYISSGDETNIITGALAVHTTGYNRTVALKYGALLLNPVNLNLNKKYVGAESTKKTKTTEIAPDDTPEAFKSNKEYVRSVKDGVNSISSNPVYYPGLSQQNSALAVKQSERKGFKNSSTNGIAPVTQLSVFQTNHTPNMRVSADLLNQFAYEVGDASTAKPTLTLIDISDTYNFTNGKELQLYSKDAYLKAVQSKFESSENQLYTEITKNNITTLNLDNQVWIDKETAISNAKDLTGQKLKLDRGYILLGSASGLDAQEAQQFVDLINSGTVSIESFGDTSIYSHFGQVKLGLDNMVRITRDHRFIIQNDTSYAYVSFTPDHMTIRNVKNDGYGHRGYISLESDKVYLWPEKYLLPKPTMAETYLCYDPKRGDNGNILADEMPNGLVWRTMATGSGTVPGLGLQGTIDAQWGTNGTNFTNSLYYYCIGELRIIGAPFESTDALSLCIYLNTAYYVGDVQLHINFNGNPVGIVDECEAQRKFHWYGVYPLYINMIDNTIRKPNKAPFDGNHNRNSIVSPIGIAAAKLNDTSSNTHTCVYRFYTPHVNDEPLGWFTHNIEIFDNNDVINWDNYPSEGWVEDPSTEEKYMCSVMKNYWNNDAASGEYKFSAVHSPVIPLNKVTPDGKLKWYQFNDSVETRCFVGCTIKSPLHVTSGAGMEPLVELNEVTDDNISQPYQPHVLVYVDDSSVTTSTTDKVIGTYGRKYKWVTGSEFSSMMGISGGGSGSTGDNDGQVPTVVQTKVKIESLNQ